MSSAWGKSWGLAFGAAFGAVLAATPAPPVMGGGGGMHFATEAPCDLALQIQQEDEILILAVAHMVVQGVFV